MDPAIAEKWIEHLETIFGVIDCSSEKKVQLAVFKLEDKAKRWWMAVRPSMSDSGASMTWEEFKRKFFAYYFPEPLRARKEAEFLALKQGEMTEEQYINRFLDLAKYSTYLQATNDDKWKAQRLLEGAKPELRERLAVVTISSFEDMCAKIYSLAQRMRETQEEERCIVVGSSSSQLGPTGGVSKNPGISKRFWKGGTSSGERCGGNKVGDPSQGRMDGGPHVAISSCGSSTVRSPYSRCGIRHRNRTCPVCHICGKLGHFRRKCPQNRSFDS